VNENQTSEPQHSSGFISIRAAFADAQSYRFVRLLALLNSLQRSARCQRMNNLSELSASLAESNDRCFGAFQDDQLIGVVSFSLFCIQREAPRLSWGAMFCLHSVRNGCGDRAGQASFKLGSERARHSESQQLTNKQKRRFVFTDGFPPLWD